MRKVITRLQDVTYMHFEMSSLVFPQPLMNVFAEYSVLEGTVVGFFACVGDLH